MNHSPEHYTFRVGERITQMVLIKKFDVDFEQVSNPNFLETAERDIGSFVSTGMTSLEPFIKKK